jgi:hypothetical protein
MSTTGSAELIRPSSSPLATFALGVGSVGLTVELVAVSDGLFVVRDVVVLGGEVIVLWGNVVEVAGEVVVVLACVEVPEARSTFAGWCAAGVVFELVRVKTSTRRRRGLDHISR